MLVSLTVGKGGHDVDFNIITSVYGKDSENVVRWVKDGKLLYANKEKALDYISVSAPVAEAQSNQELKSAANIIRNFENPNIETEENEETIEKSSNDADLQGRNGIGALIDAVDRKNQEVVAYKVATSTPSGAANTVTSGDWDKVSRRS